MWVSGAGIQFFALVPVSVGSTFIDSLLQPSRLGSLPSLARTNILQLAAVSNGC